MTHRPVGQLLHQSLTMFSVMFAFHYPNNVLLTDNYKTLNIVLALAAGADGGE